MRLIDLPNLEPCVIVVIMEVQIDCLFVYMV